MFEELWVGRAVCLCRSHDDRRESLDVRSKPKLLPHVLVLKRHHSFNLNFRLLSTQLWCLREFFPHSSRWLRTEDVAHGTDCQAPWENLDLWTFDWLTPFLFDNSGAAWETDKNWDVCKWWRCTCFLIGCYKLWLVAVNAKRFKHFQGTLKCLFSFYFSPLLRLVPKWSLQLSNRHANRQSASCYQQHAKCRWIIMWYVCGYGWWSLMIQI